MPYKDAEKRKLCRREWYKKNKKSELSHVKRRKDDIKKWFKEYKAELSCSICNEDHPATIDFHHKDGKDKEQGISYMVANGYSIDRIKKELAKCEILCSNCHRKKHFKNNKL